MTALPLPWVYPSIGESMRGDALPVHRDARLVQQRNLKGEMLSLDSSDERRGGGGGEQETRAR
jgi:hypothetical protein